jgi:hypothetical protein
LRRHMCSRKTFNMFRSCNIKHGYHGQSNSIQIAIEWKMGNSTTLRHRIQVRFPHSLALTVISQAAFNMADMCVDRPLLSWKVACDASTAQRRNIWNKRSTEGTGLQFVPLVNFAPFGPPLAPP